MTIRHFVNRAASYVAPASSPEIPPAVLVSGAGTAADPSVFTTTDATPSGSVIVGGFFGGVGFTSCVDSASNAYTGSTAVLNAGNRSIIYASATGNALASGGTLSVDINIAVAIQGVVAKFPSAAGALSFGTGSSGSSANPNITIDALADAPRYIVVIVGHQANGSSLTTPAGWTKLDASSTTFGVSMFYKRVSVTDADSFSASITSTNWSCGYVTFPADAV